MLVPWFKMVQVSRNWNELVQVSRNWLETELFCRFCLQGLLQQRCWCKTLLLRRWEWSNLHANEDRAKMVTLQIKVYHAYLVPSKNRFEQKIPDSNSNTYISRHNFKGSRSPLWLKNRWVIWIYHFFGAWGCCTDQLQWSRGSEGGVMDIHGASVDGQSSWDMGDGVRDAEFKEMVPDNSWRKSRKFHNNVFMLRDDCQSFLKNYINCGDSWTPKWNMKQLACDCHRPPKYLYPKQLCWAPFTDTKAPCSTVTSPVASIRQDESEMIWHPPAFLGCHRERLPFEATTLKRRWDCFINHHLLDPTRQLPKPPKTKLGSEQILVGNGWVFFPGIKNTFHETETPKVWSIQLETLNKLEWTNLSKAVYSGPVFLRWR